MTLHHHIFMLKYGTQKQREAAVHDALHAATYDATMDSLAAHRIDQDLRRHVEEHGDNAEIHKFRVHLDKMANPDEDDE